MRFEVCNVKNKGFTRSKYYFYSDHIYVSFNSRGRSDIFKIIREGGVKEHFVQTNNDKIPFFKIRTNKNNLYQDCNGALELL